MDKFDAFLYQQIGRKKFIILTLANYTIFTVLCMFLCYSDIITGGKELVENCSVVNFVCNTILLSFLCSLSFSSFGNVTEVPLDTSLYLGIIFCISQYLIASWRCYDGGFHYRIAIGSVVPLIGIFGFLFLAIKKDAVFDFFKKLDRISYLSYSIVVYLIFSVICIKLFSSDFSESTMSLAQNYGLPGIFVYVLGTSIPFFLWHASGEVMSLKESIGLGFIFFAFLFLFVYQRCNHGKFNKLWRFAPFFPIANIIVLFWLSFKKDNPTAEETSIYGDPDSYERTYSNDDSDKKN